MKNRKQRRCVRYTTKGGETKKNKVSGPPLAPPTPVSGLMGREGRPVGCCATPSFCVKTMKPGRGGDGEGTGNKGDRKTEREREIQRSKQGEGEGRGGKGSRSCCFLVG